MWKTETEENADQKRRFFVHIWLLGPKNTETFSDVYFPFFSAAALSEKQFSPSLGNQTYAEFSACHKPHSIIFHCTPFFPRIRKQPFKWEENSFSLFSSSTLSPAPFSSRPLLLLGWGCRRHHNHCLFRSSSCTRKFPATIFTSKTPTTQY